MTAEILLSVRELDCRGEAGIQVRLLWCEQDGRLWVAVLDTRTGDSFCLDVRDGERPLDVFHHPYAYAAHHRSEIRPRSTAARHSFVTVPSRASSRNAGL
jgi:hypothetical protein